MLQNIAVAVKLRTLFLQLGWKPVIQAVIYDTEKLQAIQNSTNFKGQAYDIDYIGDMKTSYSEKVILKSDLEKDALARHMKWVDKSASPEKKLAEEKNTEEKIINSLTVKELLGMLDVRERQIIIFRYFNGKTQQEVAKKLNISQVQVSRIEKKVLNKLRECV